MKARKLTVLNRAPPPHVALHSEYAEKLLITHSHGVAWQGLDSERLNGQGAPPNSRVRSREKSVIHLFPTTHTHTSVQSSQTTRWPYHAVLVVLSSGVVWKLLCRMTLNIHYTLRNSSPHTRLDMTVCCREQIHLSPRMFRQWWQESKSAAL